MFEYLNGKKPKRLLAFCIFCLCIIPKLLAFIYGCMDPFTNSLIALGVETQINGHIPLAPYTIAGTWQTHANFISSRAGVISFFVTLSSITGLSISCVSHFPIPGIIYLIVSYVLGRKIGGVILGLLFAVSFGFMWQPTLTTSSFGYQSYGNLLQILIIFILVCKLIDQNRLQREYFILIILAFYALLQSYYMAEFLTLSIITIMSFLLLYSRKIGLGFQSRNNIHYLALCLCIAFLAFDSIAYEFLEGVSFSLLFASASEYFSYVSSVIFGEISTAQEYRPYTHPISKCIDLASVMITWVIMLSGIVYYAYDMRRHKSKSQFNKYGSIYIIVLSLFFTFFARVLIYASKGKVSIGWPLQTIIVYSLIQICFISRLKTKLKYALPILLVFMSIVRFSLIWYDQSMSMTANYNSLVKPSSNWIGNNLYSGSVVSSNQISAEVFSILSEFRKANDISVNQFGNDAKGILLYPEENLTKIFSLRQYDYLLLSKSFENQPIYGGFWGPYIRPLGNKLEVFNNYTRLSKIYDNNILFLYWFSDVSK